MNVAEPLQAAIEEFAKFPGVGKKTALRLALHLLNRDERAVERFAETMLGLKAKLRRCVECHNVSVEERCAICASPKRDRSAVCVVEDVADVLAVERSNEFHGLYHVLGGALSPLGGVGYEDIRADELIARVEASDEIREVILALDADAEGETTSLYLARRLAPLGVSVSRIASGVPIGGDLEFADEATIGKAVAARTKIE